MKIVQTNKAYFPLIGGVETTVANLSEGLARMDGITVEVLTCHGERSFSRSSSTVRGVPVTYMPTWARIASLPISPSYGFSLAKLQGDILHIHEPFPLADLSLLFWPSIKKNFSRVVLSWHSDIVRQRWALAIYAPVIRKLLDAADSILVGSPN